MRNKIFLVATLGFFAMFVGCSGEQNTEASGTTITLSTEAPATADVTTGSIETDSTETDVADEVVNASDQITEGAKMVGRGLKEEARQAMAAGGAVMEQAGQSLQDKAEAAAPEDSEPLITPAPVQVASGASIFKAKCISCHGADASGNTAIGRKNNIADLRSPEVQGMTDTELASVIVNGKPKGASEAAHKSKKLTSTQVEDVVAYLRSIRG